MGNLRKCVLDSHKVLNLLADVLDKVLVTGQPQKEMHADTILDTSATFTRLSLWRSNLSLTFEIQLN
jgi:hypothetical protein